MDLAPSTIAPFWLATAQWLWWPFLAWVLWRAPWRYLGAPGNLNRLLAFSVAQFLLWQIRADIMGLHLHLLGATVLTLMFGWRLATLAGLLALAMTFYREPVPLQTLVFNAWLTVVLPVAASYVFARAVEWLFPRHFFVYIYLCAFAGGALSMLAVGFGRWVLDLAPAGVGSEFLPHVVLMFPEAFLSGGLITLMVAYMPGWVASFDDRRYLYWK